VEVPTSVELPPRGAHADPARQSDDDRQEDCGRHRIAHGRRDQGDDPQYGPHEQPRALRTCRVEPPANLGDDTGAYEPVRENEERDEQDDRLVAEGTNGFARTEDVRSEGCWNYEREYDEQGDDVDREDFRREESQGEREEPEYVGDDRRHGISRAYRVRSKPVSDTPGVVMTGWIVRSSSYRWHSNAHVHRVAVSRGSVEDC
jgi:hypothetical protein